MREFVYKGKTLPDTFRFKKDTVSISGMIIKFEPKEGQTFFEVNYTSGLNDVEAEKKIENILDAWTREMSFKYDREIRFAKLYFGPVGGKKEGYADFVCRIITAKDSIDPIPEYTEIINSHDIIRCALDFYIRSLTARDPFFYHYIVYEAIQVLCSKKITLSDINFDETIQELTNFYRHFKPKASLSEKCKVLLKLPKTEQIDIVRRHSKEIIKNCILRLQKLK